ncbi:MAG: hypothetical protein V3V95_06250 [Thermodesulfobacteriota bacterium]
MDVLLYGAGLLGTQMHYLVETYFKDKMKVVGFVDDVQQKGVSVTGNLKNLGSLEEVCNGGDYPPEKVRMILAIGYSNMKGRGDAFRRAKGLGYGFESIVHPGAHVEKNVSLGEGVMVLAGAIIDQFTVVKDMNYLDIGVKVGENSVIEENNYFSSGTTIAGSVKIGSNNFFGLDTTVVNDVSIGSNNSINAKSLIYKDLGDNKKVVVFHEQRIMES